tara:strand:- start:1016 stop:1978 length:963 start_codon:yes stop_codon:yes gene_type:complete
MINKKTILLTGFNFKEIKNLKKKFKNILFEEYKVKHKYKKNFNALVSKNRSSFNLFYFNDFEKFKKDLKWIHISAAGLDIYPKLFLLNNSCKVTNGKIIQGPEVADHAMGLLLSLTRKINYLSKFGLKSSFDYRPIELKDKSILVVGYGGVGKCIAERSHGFGLKVYAVHNEVKQRSKYVKKFYKRKQFKYAIKNKDIIVFSLPLTSKTKHLYNEKTAKLLKKGAFLINVCRGGVVCEKTLFKYLKNNTLSGAGVDVLGKNDNLKLYKKFSNFKNFIFTPHVAGISDNLKKRNETLIENNIKRFSKNQELINVIDKTDLK